MIVTKFLLLGYAVQYAPFYIPKELSFLNMSNPKKRTVFITLRSFFSSLSMSTTCVFTCIIVLFIYGF